MDKTKTKYTFLWRENYVDYLWATNVTVPAYFQKEGVLIYEQHQLSAYASDKELEQSSEIGNNLFRNHEYKNVFAKLKTVVEKNSVTVLQYSKPYLREMSHRELLGSYENLFESMRNFVNQYRYTEPYYLTTIEASLDRSLQKKESDQERRVHLKVRLLSNPDNKQDIQTARMVKLLHEISKERFEAKRMDAAMSDCAENLLEETARRVSMAVTQVSSLTKTELEQLLLDNVKPDINTVNKRKHTFALEVKNPNIKEYVGEEFGDFKASIISDEQLTSKQVLGSTAFPGRVTGKAIVLPPISTTEEYEEFIDKFKDGSVLVAPMTSPELVPIFKKVIAIITDEGGITSHAALIAREMKIPCIVGTSYATKLIRNDMDLLIDATKGEVTII